MILTNIVALIMYKDKMIDTGNRLVQDVAYPLMYSGAFDFKNGTTIATEYVYDGCGALTQDKNKGIALIDYDFNGMPTRIQFMNGSVIENFYSAEGVKLKSIHRTAVSGLHPVYYGARHTLTAAETQSVDSVLYVNNLEVGNNFNSKFYFGNGYIALGNTGSGTYHYTVKDHLGSIRSVVSSDGTVEQINNYLAYGGLQNDVQTGADVQTHKYNEKELDRMYGLDTYDYGARNYDAALGQFTTMDNYCEKYYHLSPYSYCGGNPIRNIDENGDSICVLIQFNGAYGAGHMGVLLQKDENTWVYYSKNGDVPQDKQDLGEETFTSPDKFFASKTGERYDEGFVIHDGTCNEDAAIEATAKAVGEPYSICFSNCAQAVQKGLEAAHVGTGRPNLETAQNIANGTPRPLRLTKYMLHWVTPNLIYKNVIKQNLSKENRNVYNPSKTH